MADFRPAMTGTPAENPLTDFCPLSDTGKPGPDDDARNLEVSV